MRWLSDGVRSLFHDMVLTKVPGDVGYSPVVNVIGCFPVEGVYVGGTYTNEADVLAAWLEDGEITCIDLGVMFGMVVG